MDDERVYFERLLTSDDAAWGELPPGWRQQSLAELGVEQFAGLMVQASQGDPFDTSTPETAEQDLRDLIEMTGEAFDANAWVALSDAAGPIGVVLPQPYPDGELGTVMYLGVMPQRRGAGLGQALYRIGLGRLAATGVRRVVDATDTRNEPMQRILAAAGVRQMSPP